MRVLSRVLHKRASDRGIEARAYYIMAICDGTIFALATCHLHGNNCSWFEGAWLAVGGRSGVQYLSELNSFGLSCIIL